VHRENKDRLIDSKDRDMFARMDGELTRIIEDFDRDINIAGSPLSQRN